jgi:hypothetical protein
MKNLSGPALAPEMGTTCKTLETNRKKG